MSKVTTSSQNNITSPNGNSLAVFIDGVTEVMKVKDVMGNIQPLSDFTGCLSPFKYDTNGTGIEPILGTNNASGTYATIGGGGYNTAPNSYSTIGGGTNNTASGNCSMIGGGQSNNASGYYSVIGGGCLNTASGSYSTVGGGGSNTGSGGCSVVGGGYRNTASNTFSTISGGYCNTASGAYSAILGGRYNNTSNFANAMIVGSNLCATQACTTFMNCTSVNNLTQGCLVCVGANKVLENSNINASTVNAGLFAQIADSVPITATTVESSLIGAGVGTLSVPANAFEVGDSFDARLDGTISCVGTATLHIRVKTLSGSLLADTGIIAMDASTLKSWTLDLQFTIRTLGTTGVASISSGGLFSYIKNSGTNFEGFVLSTINGTTFDTTINNTLVITAQWNTNNATNSIFSRNFVLNKVY